MISAKDVPANARILTVSVDGEGTAKQYTKLLTVVGERSLLSVTIQDSKHLDRVGSV